MAYKDEYEVARLHLDAAERARIGPQLGRGRTSSGQPASAGPARPGHEAQAPAGPLVRARASGRCGAMRRLRGTPLDPFGLARVRRVERALIGEYRAAVGEALARLTPETHATVVELRELPDVIRGYEDIKLKSVKRFRERATVLAERL